MKLVSFELKKLFTGKIKWILLFLFFINLAIYYVYLMPFLLTKQEDEIKQEWMQTAETRNGSVEEKLQFLKEEQRDFSMLSLYFLDSEWLDETEKEIITKKYKDTKYWDSETAAAASRALSQIMNEYQSVLDYELFIDGLQEKADKMIRVPIFAKKGGFSNQNIQKTAEDFKRMEGIKLEAVDGTGVEAFQDFYLTDILMILLICLFCFQQFGQDRRSGMANLLQATPNGKGKLRFSQMRAIWIAVIGFGIVLYGSNLLLTIGYFHLNESFSKYIQAITVFRNVPFPLTIGIYISLYLLGKLAAIFLITTVCQLLAIKMNGESLAWLLFGILISISFGLWFFLPDSPIAKIFQYLNLIGILDMKQILGNYQNLNVFSYPVMLLSAAILFILVVSLVAILFTLKVKKTEWQIRKLERKSESGKHIWKSVFYYEQYKIFWKQKIWLILIVLVGIAFSEFSTEEELIRTEEFFYNQYIAELEGAYSEEKNQAVQELVSNSEITNSEQRKAVEQIEKQAQNLQKQSSKNIAFLNEKQIGRFFFDTQKEMKNTIVIVIAILLSIHSLFYQDKKTNMQQLLYGMPKSNQIYWNKIKIGALLGGIYTIIIWSLAYAQYFLKYGIQNTEFLIQSISEFGEMPVTCSILEYMIVSIGIRILIGIYIGIFLAFLSELFTNPTQNIIIGSIILVLPTCLAMIGNMGYQNSLVTFINNRLNFLLKPVQLLTALQCKWYQTGIVSMVLFCAIPIIVMLYGYVIWKRHRLK